MKKEQMRELTKDELLQKRLEVRQTKIGQFYISRDHHIGRFDIAVNNASTMSIAQCPQNTHRDIEDDIERKQLTALQDFRKCLSSDVFHDQVESILALINKKIVERGDIGVIQTGMVSP